MKLWTIQTKNFDITKGRIDHSLSEYYQSIKTIPDAYKKLWDLIGISDGQIIWCYTKPAFGQISIYRLPKGNRTIFKKLMDKRYINSEGFILGKFNGIDDSFRTDFNELPHEITDKIAAYFKRELQNNCINLDTYKIWDLDVPNSEILSFIHNFNWNRLIGRRSTCILPEDIRSEFKNEALRLFPSDYTQRKDHFCELEKEFRTKKPPSGTWWDHLIFNKINNEDFSAIIKHPISSSWIFN